MAEIDADQQAWDTKYFATLAALRKPRGITQTDVAERLGASQSEVSRIERRDDVLVSTLRGFVTARARTSSWWPALATATWCAST